MVCIIYGCSYRQIKIRKIGDKKFSVFLLAAYFGPYLGSWDSVYGGLHHLRMRLQPDKNQKNWRQKVFRFYYWQHISAHISGHGCYKCIWFTLVCIIYECACSQIKNRKIGVKKFSVFTAGSIFWPISRVMGVINEFGFRWFASFTNGLTAR